MWWFILGLTIFAILWATVIRPQLRNRPYFKAFFDWVEPIETMLYRKSEGIFWARYQQFMGILIMVLAYLGQLDVSIVNPVVAQEYQPFVPLALNLSGTIAESLRRDTSKPLEVIAAPGTPAMARAEVRLDEAIKEAKINAATETAKAA